MSKASKYDQQYWAAVSAVPQKPAEIEWTGKWESGRTTAWARVESGFPKGSQPRLVINQSLSYINADDAVSLALWILETFGDS